MLHRLTEALEKIGSPAAGVGVDPDGPHYDGWGFVRACAMAATGYDLASPARQSDDWAEAVIEAASLRLRPILMTTGAMVLGSVPLAIASGAGAESRHQIGWVIVGGMSLGTLLTLFVLPTVYSYLAYQVPHKREAEGTHPVPAE